MTISGKAGFIYYLVANKWKSYTSKSHTRNLNFMILESHLTYTALLTT